MRDLRALVKQKMSAVREVYSSLALLGHPLISRMALAI
jgi:hypothetical protein